MEGVGKPKTLTSSWDWTVGCPHPCFWHTDFSYLQPPAPTPPNPHPHGCFGLSHPH